MFGKLFEVCKQDSMLENTMGPPDKFVTIQALSREERNSKPLGIFQILPLIEEREN